MKRFTLLICLSLAACEEARLRTIPPEPIETNVRREVSRDVCFKTPKAEGIKQLDVLFLMDTTGSMTFAIKNLQDNVRTMLEELKLQVADVRFAVARFDDYRPICALAQGTDDPSDTTYTLLAPLTSDGDVLQTAVAGLTRPDGAPMGNGADGLACGYEALYQAATGVGLDTNKDGVYFGVDALYDVAPMPAGWRGEAKKVIVMITDASFVEIEKQRSGRGGTNDTWVQDTRAIQDKLQQGGAATKQQALDALNMNNIKLVGIAVGTQRSESFPDLRTVAEATGTFTFTGFSPLGTDYTQLGAISPGGPLVFRTDAAGNPYASGKATMAKTMVDSLADIVNATDVKLTLDVTGESKRTEEQVQLVIEPQLAEGVPPETEVCFTVRAEWPSARKAALPSITAKVETNGKEFGDKAVTLAE
ncbi:MAG: VWA domain-containing protein [Deltaproteobacteria bacterium]|nr:VWA domain-containing protein [Deltaproteobacteria bacterium]